MPERRRRDASSLQPSSRKETRSAVPGMAHRLLISPNPSADRGLPNNTTFPEFLNLASPGVHSNYESRPGTALSTSARRLYRNTVDAAAIAWLQKYSSTARVFRSAASFLPHAYRRTRWCARRSACFTRRVAVAPGLSRRLARSAGPSFASASLPKCGEKRVHSSTVSSGNRLFSLMQ